MQALVHAIATVQVRIQTNGPLYANNEYQTRYGLIDPILHALEWDTANPDEVQVEYPVVINNQNNAADYVLLCQDKPLVVIEAKSLSTNLARARVQGFVYCSSIGAAYLVCTDGNQWDLYETQSQQLLQKIQLSSLSVYDAALKLLCLWKPIVCTSPKSIPQIISFRENTASFQHLLSAQL
jgi:predicted type IV restriction endonuclease